MSLRRKYWSNVGIWAFLIYSTLYFVRPLCEFLRETTPFNFLVNTMLLIVLSIVFYYLFFRVKFTLQDTAYTIVLAICCFFIFTKITIPEERIHFVEYGIMAGLIYRAVSIDVKNVNAYILACVLNALLGWVDEIIQYFLPNRYFDWHDVLFNALGGILGLMIVAIFSRKQTEENKIVSTSP